MPLRVRVMGLVCLVVGVAVAAEEEVYDMDASPVSAPVTAAVGEPVASADAHDMDSGTGELPANAISDGLRKNQSAVQDCVSRHGAGALAGRVVLQWEVLATGAVANASVVESNVRNPPFEACLLSSVRRIRFAAPTGGTVIASHPFVFQP